MKKSGYIALIGSVLAALAQAATEIAWIGGSSGNVKDTANWEGGVIPSGENAGTYIAVFDKSVNLTNSGYWYPAGIKVTGNSVVTVDGGHLKAAGSLDGNECVFDLAAGSTFEVSTSLQGYDGATLVLRGGGTLKALSAVGYDTLTSTYQKLRIEAGEFKTPGSMGYVRFLDEIRIQSGGRFTCTVAETLDMSADTGRYPVVVVEQGGVFDCGDLAQTVPALAGDGTVDALPATKGITLALTQSGKVFSGTIQGRLLTTTKSGVTPTDAFVVISNADTLAAAVLKPAQISQVRFAADAATYYVGDVPSGDFRDVNGDYVLLRRPGNSWYVDQACAASGDGTTLGTAFKTIPEALAVAVAYDTVYVAPGTYADTPMSLSSSTTSNRVSLASNVRLVSLEGPEKTTILGAPAPSGANQYGLGNLATRCVEMLGYAWLEGFTLTGGRTATENEYGGGVKCAGTGCMVVDCIITNNVSNRGGGGRSGTYVRCRINENRVTSLGGGVTEECRLYNCQLDGNKEGAYVIFPGGNPATVVNTTFGPNNTADCDIRADGSTDAKRTHVYNSVLMKGLSSNSANVGLHRSFVAVTLPAACPPDEDCILTNLTTASEKLAAAGLDAALHPVLGGAVVDYGNHDLSVEHYPSGYRALASKDLAGGVRVRGTEVDLGAYEYDPTSGYPTILALDAVAEAALSVPAATGAIVARADNKALRLADGATLTVRFARSAAPTTVYSFGAGVVGGGALAVTVDEAAEPSLVITDAVGIRTVSSAADVVLRFSFAGEGYAELQQFANETAFEVSVPGGGVVMEGAEVGRNVVAYDASRTVVLRQGYDSEKLCVGVAVDGQFVSFADWPNGWSMTVPGTERSKVIRVEAVYQETCSVWYMSPTGSDSNKGYHRNAPWKTFAYAMSQVKSGETVRLLEGVFDADTMTSGERAYRVVVPSGVTLENADEIGSAVIVGAEATVGLDTEGLGIGSDAVSCVNLGSGSVLRGLTIRNGRTPNVSNGYAGGVYGTSSSLIEDCVVTNCAAYRGGAVWSGECRRCRFYANNAHESCSVAQGTVFYDCLFRNNGNIRQNNVTWNCQARNCTFLPDVIKAQAGGWGSDQRTADRMVNCVLWCAQANYPCYTHCAFVTGTADYVHDENMGEGSFRFDSTATGMNPDGTLTKTSPFVDAGILATGYSPTNDAWQSQRVYNGTIDMGASEYDWRGDFKRELTRKKSVSLDLASPAVTTNALGGVLLPGDGAKVSTTWMTTVGVKAVNSFVVEVAGEGELAYTLNGVEIRRFTAADGRCTVDFSNDLGTNVVVFAFAGEGSAVIADFKCDAKGLILLVK